ncbi:MAG TPA: ABC transporter substrate-binding protein [Candidatus Binatia bacterium]|nr:ABC transporter substrate-binding protein [Candidatus Binatia bacterium]
MKRSAALALLCGLPAIASAGRADTLTPIKVGASYDEDFAEGFFGADSGIFKQAGLDAAVTGLMNGGALAAAVMSGSLDVVTTNTGAMATAHARGLPLVLIAPGANYSNTAVTAALLVLKDSPIKTAGDLSGKTIAVTTLRTLYHTSVRNWIDKNGGNSEAAAYLELPLSTMLPALKGGRVDAIACVEPWVTQAKPETRVLGVPYASLAPAFMISGWVTTKTWYDANRDTARKFVRSVEIIANWANKNPQATAAIMSKYFSVPLETVASMQRTKMSTKLDPSYIQPVIDVLYKYKVIDRQFAAAELFATA